MEISVKWNEGQYPSFNVALASKSGNEPFLELKGCRIAKGKDGEFVSPPSTKGNNGKYWNHAYLSKDFAAVVLEKAKESKPKQTKQESVNKSGGSFDDFPEDCPF